MLVANRMAFKEWAVITAALGNGRQSLILRKGGIHEGRDGFRVEHHEFWLFPTNFHQSANDLSEEYRELWESVRRNPPPAETIPLRSYAILDEVIEVTDAVQLPGLAGLHGWSEQVVHDRFHYRQPGLLALLVRVYELPVELRIPNSPHFAGCRSWVELPTDLPTAALSPVLPQAEHQRRMELIRKRLISARQI